MLWEIKAEFLVHIRWQLKAKINELAERIYKVSLGPRQLKYIKNHCLFLTIALINQNPIPSKGSPSQRLTSKQLSIAPCQFDIFSLQAPIFSTQLKAIGCSLDVSAFSTTAFELSTYLENTVIKTTCNSAPLLQHYTWYWTISFFMTLVLQMQERKPRDVSLLNTPSCHWATLLALPLQRIVFNINFPQGKQRTITLISNYVQFRF